MNQNPDLIPSLNRNAIISLVLSIFAVLSFCVGAAPLPLTALFCYPASLLLGIGALWMGMKALQQIRQNEEDGQTIAQIGIWVGSITILFIICAVTLVIILGPHLFNVIQEGWGQLFIE